MIRTLLLLILSVVLSASTQKIEQKIFQTIIEGLFPHKRVVNVWSDDPQKKSLLASIAKVSIVAKPEDADILFLKKIHAKLPKKALIFAVDYRTLKAYREKAVGGFYWQKGRPNLVFFNRELHSRHIRLPKEMHKYIDRGERL